MPNHWIFKPAQGAFPHYKETWQRLARRVLGCQHPLADYDYVAPLLQQFGDPRVLLALRNGTGESGMVLVTRCSFGVWSTFTPGTGPFNFALIESESEEEAEHAIGSLIRALPGFAFSLSLRKLDPLYRTIAARETGPRYHKADYMETLRIPTDRPFTDYWAERGKNLKRDIIKKTNRLSNAGIVHRLDEITLPDDMDSAVESYAQLEAKGWKGKAGTAVGVDRNSDVFYRHMLQGFAQRHSASAYQLYFGDDIVASAITVRGCDMAIILKIAFDESFHEYSPGLMMMYELHKRLFSLPDVKVIEYYGRATERAKQWAVGLRTIYHVDIYRSAMLGQFLHQLRLARSALRHRLGKKSPGPV